MTEISDHDRLTIMNEQLKGLTTSVVELKNDFNSFKNDNRKDMKAFRDEIIATLNKSMDEAKNSAVKYADNAVISAFRDKGCEMFAEKKVETIIYATIKILLYSFLGALITAAGFTLY